jgi:acetolactate synthase-1/2/3 large subunit
MKVINIDVDPSQTARLRPDVAVVSDAALGARALDAALADAGVQRASRHDEFQALKDRTWAAVQKIQPQLDYLKAIRAALPRDGFFVEEICQAGFASYYGLPIYEPRTFVTCGHQGTLGFGFPTALGVKAGNPDKAVVAITGDGGFMFGMQDLATAAQYNLGVVTVLFDNGAYGNVLRDQKRVFAGRVIGAELRNPDFVKLAESFGVHGVRANTPADLQREIALAIDRNAPALIVVSVDPTTEVSPWEFLMPAPYSV